LSPPARPSTAGGPGWGERLFRSKVFIWILLVLPGLYAGWPIFRQDPTVLADPLKYLLHHFGFVACILLAAVLALTPLRVLFPRWRIALALNRHRRLIGVGAFFYALIHLAFQFLHEGGWPTFFTDIKKPFLLMGMLAFLILLALAVTSFNFMVRWMGGRRWKNLHRLAYLAALLAAFHQALAHKLFPVQVLWIFVPLAILEVARIARQRMKPAVAPVPAPSRG
jgi:methionine sulfoxide reductase heme-binding subunit